MYYPEAFADPGVLDGVTSEDAGTPIQVLIDGIQHDVDATLIRGDGFNKCDGARGMASLTAMVHTGMEYILGSDGAHRTNVREPISIRRMVCQPLCTSCGRQSDAHGYLRGTGREPASKPVIFSRRPADGRYVCRDCGRSWSSIETARDHARLEHGGAAIEIREAGE